MFTGIIEATGHVIALEKVGSNLNLQVQSPLSHLFKIDQSVSHNGVCLTITHTSNDTHSVSLVQETLLKTNFNSSKVGDILNLEQSITLQNKIDGHLVQGHIDTTAELIEINNLNGSYELRFSFHPEFNTLIIEKGSICLNGVSLTIFNISNTQFSVAIIPYTWEHTNLKFLKLHDLVNIEFDMIGKYVQRFISISTKK